MVKDVCRNHLLIRILRTVPRAVLVLHFLLLASCLKETSEVPQSKVSYSKLEIFPTVQSLSSGESQVFYGINGVPPYTYSLTVGTGTIDASSGLFTANGATGTSVVQVVDSVGQEAVALVFIVDQLKLTPTSVNITADGVLSFSAFGGSPPYSYSITLGDGTVDALTGSFTAPSTPGTTIVEVVDKNGVKLSSVVTTVEKPNIDPSLAIIEVKSELKFKTFGGVEPYTYSVFSGGGSINPTTGIFTADTIPGTAVVEVRDRYGFNSFSQVQIINSNKIAAGAESLCVYLGSNKTVKCWGRNNSGQLGNSSTNNIGDNSYEMGVSLASLDFGYSGIVDPKDIFAGKEHFCVLMENGEIKCWGNNGYGQLGLGDTLNRGDDELVKTVPVVSLGTGIIKPLLMSAGGHHNCVVFEDNQVKCWGRNDLGQLGQGHTTNRGDSGGQMDASLVYTDLGSIDSIKTIRSGSNHSCVLTNTNKVKCWGHNTYGQLGLGDNNNRGDANLEMGDNLPFLDFGDLTELNISDIALGENHTCVLFSNGKAKCWGLNTFGQLGLGDNVLRGTTGSQTPANLPYIDLGTFEIKTLSAGFNQTCAIDLNGAMKCWGNNSSAQLGQLAGNNLGDSLSEMGANLASVELGSISKARKASSGDGFTCAILTDGRFKCFGSNSYGQMGMERTDFPYDIIGDAAGEMGDYLFPVDL